MLLQNIEVVKQYLAMVVLYNTHQSQGIYTAVTLYIPDPDKRYVRQKQ